MKVTQVEYNQIQFLPALIQDYLNRKEELKPLYQFNPDLEGYRELIESRSNFPGSYRQTLVEVLNDQYEALDNKDLQSKHISLLAEANTFTVTTGHQLCLFTGPSYFIYKILSVVKLAKQLKHEFPANNFVPIYWMASEDHDFEEINHFFAEDHKVSWKAEKGGAVGRLSGDLESILAEVQACLGLGNESKELIQLFHSCYCKGNVAGATRELVHRLLGHFGIVTLDPDDKRLKALFTPVMSQELKDQSAYKAIETSSQKLESLGYKAQVHPREINLFYLTDSDRQRIVLEGEVYQTTSKDKRWSIDAISSELIENPERFSPNVVMRPMYQECILPNLSYTGGAGELSYWFQLKEAFDQYKVSFPILCLRNSAVVIDANDSKRMQKLQLEVNDLFENVLLLEDRIINQHSSNNTQLDQSKAELTAVFDRIKEQAGSIQPDLIVSTDATLAKVFKLMDGLEKKLERGEKVKHRIVLEQLHRVLNKVYPNGVFQERRMNFSTIYKQVGSGYLDALYSGFDPLNPTITVLELD